MAKKRKTRKSKRELIRNFRKQLTRRDGKKFTAHKQERIYAKATRIKSEADIERVYNERVRRDFHKFVSSQRKRGRRDFILRIHTSNFFSKKGKTTYYGSVRTRIESKKEVDLALDDFLVELLQSMRGYLKRKASILIKGVDMEADEYVSYRTKKVRRSKRKKAKTVSRNRHRNGKLDKIHSRGSVRRKKRKVSQKSRKSNR